MLYSNFHFLASVCVGGGGGGGGGQKCTSFFRIQKVEGLYKICSENRGLTAADLCFRISQKACFLMTRLNYDQFASI